MTVNGEPGQLNTFVQSARPGRGGRRAGRAAAARATCCCTSPPASSRPRATRRAGRPSSSSSRTEPRVVPVGRLDADTTGALLLTNDGAARAPARASALRRREDVRRRGRGRPDRRRRCTRSREGVELDDGPTAPAQARRLGPGRVELDHPRGPQPPGAADARRPSATRCTRLHRSAYAGLTLEGLEPGQWRELEPSEVARLRSSRLAPAPGRSARSPGRSTSSPG